MVRVDLVVEVVRVPAVQQPAITVGDGYRAVAAGVAAERDQQDLGVQAQRAHGVESAPRLAVRLRVRHPVRPARRLGGTVADAVLGASPGGRHRRAVFGLAEQHLGPGEVGQSPGMVEVEVAEDDVPDVLRRKPSAVTWCSADPPRGRGRAGLAEEVRAEALLGPRHVLRTDAAPTRMCPGRSPREKTVADRGRLPSSVSIVRTAACSSGGTIFMVSPFGGSIWWVPLYAPGTAR